MFHCMRQKPKRNREKLYITISPIIKRRAQALANTLGISASRLIEDSLKYYMEKKFGVRSDPTVEEITREIEKLDAL